MSKRTNSLPTGCRLYSGNRYESRAVIDAVVGKNAFSSAACAKQTWGRVISHIFDLIEFEADVHALSTGSFDAVNVRSCTAVINALDYLDHLVLLQGWMWGGWPKGFSSVGTIITWLSQVNTLMDCTCVSVDTTLSSIETCIGTDESSSPATWLLCKLLRAHDCHTLRGNSWASCNAEIRLYYPCTCTTWPFPLYSRSNRRSWTAWWEHCVWHHAP